jgi:GntR family transcriptional regulator
MYMSEPSGPKYRAISAALEREIRSGRLSADRRIPGEHELAKRFQVSRGTVRQALGLLTRRRLIRTYAGSGSYVEFGGDRLEWNLGWSRALAKHGARVGTRVIRLDTESLPELAARIGSPVSRFVILDRVRTVDTDVPASLERSRVPLTERTASLLDRDFARESLMTALRECGCASASSEQWVQVHRLDGDEAGLLERADGEPFLLLRRVLRGAGGDPVEYVESLLDPERFDLHIALDPRSG